MDFNNYLVGQTDNAFAILPYGAVGRAYAVGATGALNARLAVLNNKQIESVAVLDLNGAVLGEGIFTEKLAAHRYRHPVTRFSCEKEGKGSDKRYEKNGGDKDNIVSYFLPFFRA